ncbi:IclR family transcriptional regulator [Nocardia sp. CA-128927]|uniref:IclR family transcriptional regulator n=1 Tax=Nocardia sp. CA-128927 TaxID=3239975 RepID=UPI003D960A1D
MYPRQRHGGPVSDSSCSGGSVARTARVLVALGTEMQPVALSDLARIVGIPKTTVWRILQTLSASGLVERRGTSYAVGKRLMEVAGMSEGLERLRAAAVPHLVDIHESTGATVSLGVLAGAEVRFLERIYGHQPVRTPSFGHTHTPAHSTAIGKILLAYEHPYLHTLPGDGALTAATGPTIVNVADLRAELDTIRRTGIAYSAEEYASGVVCVAVPIMGGDSQPIAALSVSDTLSRLDLDQVSTQLRQAAFSTTVASRSLNRRQPTSVQRNSRQRFRGGSSLPPAPGFL